MTTSPEETAFIPQVELEERRKTRVREMLQAETTKVIEGYDGQLPELFDNGEFNEWWVYQIWHPVAEAGASQTTLEAARGHASDETSEAYGRMAVMATLFAAKVRETRLAGDFDVTRHTSSLLDRIDRPVRRSMQSAEHHQIFIRSFAQLLDVALGALEEDDEAAVSASDALAARAIEKFASHSRLIEDRSNL